MSLACKDTADGTGKSCSFQIDVHLGTSIEEEGGMETEITHRGGAGLSNCTKCSGVLSISIWGRTMCCNEATGKRIEVNEMRMLWWIGCAE